MRLFLLTSFTMLAFASNSLLTRLAIELEMIDPVSFALIRVLAGAGFLWILVVRSGISLPWRQRDRFVGALSLAAYMVGFSLAYVTLDAGLGALILFGVVQISMFAHSTLAGARPSPRQLLGAVIAFSGLMIALWPEDGAQGAGMGAALMVVAGLGWAIYTLSGKAAANPLQATAANFVLCFPVLLILGGLFVEQVSALGVVLAILCGAVTSGLGYALWYKVLPELQQNTAAIVQLSVPVIAIMGGIVFLGEALRASTVLAAALVVSGIALAVTKGFAPKHRS